MAVVQQKDEDVGYEGLSADLEGVADQPRLSKLALIAAAVMVLGLLAPIEPRLMVASAVAAVLAFVALWRCSTPGHREDYRSASRTIAATVLLLGMAATTWAVVLTYTRQSRLDAKATEVAQEYMQSLAEGKMLRAIQMVGLDPIVREDDADSEQVSRSQKAVRMYLDSYAIRQVTKRGAQARWEPEGVIARSREGDVEVFKVRFFDRAMSNPLPFDVLVNMIPPAKFAADRRYRWMIETIEQPST